MNIIRIYPNTTCDGIIVELSDKSMIVLPRTYLAMLDKSNELIDIKANIIQIDGTAYSCEGLSIVSGLSMFSKEDLKAILEICCKG